jgi:hypothetical protein
LEIEVDLDPWQYNPNLGAENCTSIRNAISSLKMFLRAFHAITQEKIVLPENNVHVLRAFRYAQRKFLCGKALLAGPYSTYSYRY